MRNTYLFFFQYINNFPNACATRGNYIINEFAKKNSGKIIVYNTNFSGSSHGVLYKKIPINISNTSSIFTRTLLEILLGICIIFNVLKEIIVNRKVKVLFSSPCFLPVLFAGTFLRKIRINYYLDIRDLYPLGYIATGVIKKHSMLVKFLTHLEKFLYKKAIHIFCATSGIQDEVNKNNFNTSVVINGFPSISIPEDSLRKRSERTQVFHVGTLGRYQDVDLLKKLITCDKLNDCDFTVIGSGPCAHLIEEISRKNLNYSRKITHEQLLIRLKSADIGLSLRKINIISKMALPVKDFEYVISGAFVVGTPYNEATAILEPLGLSKGFEEDVFERIVNFIKEFDPTKREKLDLKKIELYSRETQAKQVYNILSHE